MSKGQTDFSKRNQGKGTGRVPQRKNATSFSKKHQPANYDHVTGARGSANQKKRYLKKTQAQAALEESGHNPMQVLIGMSEVYAKMIKEKKNWVGADATAKELESYVKEYTKINENLATYQSAKAPVQQEEDKPLEAVQEQTVRSEDDPLSPKDLMIARKDMIERHETMKKNLEDKL